MKRVSRWSGFTFRCHDATNVRKRERERERERERKRERETIRKAPTKQYIKI